MLCSETGSTKAIRLPYLSLDEAIDFNTAKGLIIEHGEEGRISCEVKHGKIPIIEWMVKKLRSKGQSGKKPPRTASSKGGVTSHVSNRAVTG